MFSINKINENKITHLLDKVYMFKEQSVSTVAAPS